MPVKVAIDRWYVREASPTLDALVLVGLAAPGRSGSKALLRFRREVPAAADALA